MLKTFGDRVYHASKTRLSNGGWKKVVSFAIATLAPTLIFTLVAMNRPISFDGAMNLQVAQNVAENGQYSRNYTYANSSVEEKSTNTRVFPNEVETNGPYIVVAALAIKLFGQNQFGYQFANILFILGVATIIWWMLKRWAVAAVIAPSLVLLLLPNAFDTPLGGYGEVPALFFALLAVACVAQAAALKNQSQILKYITFAFIAAGAAIVTKTYLIGFLPALLLGMFVVKFAKNMPWKPLAFRSPYLLLIPALHEIWHLLSLGSVYGYLAWWKSQLRAVLFQSGLRKSDNPALIDQSNGIFDKVANQIEIFTNIANLLPIVLFFTASLSVLIIFSYAYGRSKKLVSVWQAAKTKYGLLLIMLSSMFVTYFVWWAVLLPAAKTFPRRTLPAMLALEIVLVLVIVIGFHFLFRYSLKAKKVMRTGNRSVSSTSKILFILLCFVLGLLLVAPLKDVYARSKRVPYITNSDYRDTVEVVKGISEQRRVYGLNWWSSPVISLMADRDFYNLDNINVCKLSPGQDIVVWDKIASAITKSPTPTMKKVEYELYRETSAATLYKLVPNDEFCAKFLQ